MPYRLLGCDWTKVSPKPWCRSKLLFGRSTGSGGRRLHDPGFRSRRSATRAQTSSSRRTNENRLGFPRRSRAGEIQPPHRIHPSPRQQYLLDPRLAARALDWLALPNKTIAESGGSRPHRSLGSAHRSEAEHIADTVRVQQSIGKAHFYIREVPGPDHVLVPSR